jgi:hypothetical protein
MIDIHQTMELADLVQKRRDVMVRILKASIAQENAIKEGLIEALVSRLNEKQVLIDCLQDLQRQLKPFASQDPADRVWPSEEDRTLCRRAIEETERLQTAILEIDGRCENLMVEHRDEILQDLNRTTDATAVARAYSCSANSRATGGSIDFSSG